MPASSATGAGSAACRGRRARTASGEPVAVRGAGADLEGLEVEGPGCDLHPAPDIGGCAAGSSRSARRPRRRRRAPRPDRYCRRRAPGRAGRRSCRLPRPSRGPRPRSGRGGRYPRGRGPARTSRAWPHAPPGDRPRTVGRGRQRRGQRLRAAAGAQRAAVAAVGGAPLRAGLVPAARRQRALALEDHLQRSRRFRPRQPQDLDAAHERAGRRRDQHALGLGAVAADLQAAPPRGDVAARRAGLGLGPAGRASTGAPARPSARAEAASTAAARAAGRRGVSVLLDCSSTLSADIVTAAFKDVTSIAAVDPVVRNVRQPLADGPATGKWRGPRTFGPPAPPPRSARQPAPARPYVAA